jgi:hypothetical protein
VGVVLRCDPYWSTFLELCVPFAGRVSLSQELRVPLGAAWNGKGEAVAGRPLLDGCPLHGGRHIAE